MAARVNQRVLSEDMRKELQSKVAKGQVRRKKSTVGPCKQRPANKDPNYSQEIVAQPRKHDILLGRGQAAQKAPGNLRFRQIIDKHSQMYSACTRAVKKDMCRDIVGLWKAQDPPGRFLIRRDDQSWATVDDMQSRTKVSQSFRDHPPNARSESVVCGAEEIPMLPAPLFLEPPSAPSGCRICGSDNKHDEMLLCETCDGEFHMRCLDPPLKKIPKNEWYCRGCTTTLQGGDGFDELVCALPPEITSRFGEICWAQGGSGYGWWPCCIYDPRLTLKSTRAVARKHLGKKHLVYFLQCDEAPFAVLSNSQIMTWDEGLASSFHMGLTAKASGKFRYVKFKEALQAACLEESIPVNKRLDFESNNGSPLQLLPPPAELVRSSQRSSLSGCKASAGRKGTMAQSSILCSPRRANTVRSDLFSKTAYTANAASDMQSGRVGLPLVPHRLTDERSEAGGAAKLKAHEAVSRTDTPAVTAADKKRTPSSSGSSGHKKLSKKQKSAVSLPSSGSTLLAESNGAAQDQLSGDMICKIFLTNDQSDPGKCIGAVFLPEGESSTFLDARNAIELTQETEKYPVQWRFVHPAYGPLSIKLEKELIILQYLTKGSDIASVGKGTEDKPAILTIMKDPLAV